MLDHRLGDTTRFDAVYTLAFLHAIGDVLELEAEAVAVCVGVGEGTELRVVEVDV